MPITVESAIKSDPAAKVNATGKKVLRQGGLKGVPRWVWIAGASVALYFVYDHYKNTGKGDIQGTNIQPPG